MVIYSESEADPAPLASSSSSWTTSLPTVMAYSAFCRNSRNSFSRGSTMSIGRCFALFRILFSAVSVQDRI